MKEWLRKRRELQNRKRFKKGFGYAMGELFIENRSLLEIEAETMTGNTPYTTGILHAVYRVRIIRKVLQKADAALPKEGSYHEKYNG